MEFLKKNGDTIQVSKKRGQITISTRNCRGRVLSNQKIFLDVGDTAQLINAIQGVLNPEDTHVDIFEVDSGDSNLSEHQKRIVAPPTGPKNDLKVAGYLHGRCLFVTILDWKGNWERVVFRNIPDQMNSQVCAEYAAIMYALDSQIRQGRVRSKPQCNLNGQVRSQPNEGCVEVSGNLELLPLLQKAGSLLGRRLDGF